MLTSIVAFILGWKGFVILCLITLITLTMEYEALKTDRLKELRRRARG